MEFLTIIDSLEIIAACDLEVDTVNRMSKCVYMSNQGQCSLDLGPASFRYQNKSCTQNSLGHLQPGFVCLVLMVGQISGERLQDHWSSGLDIVK